MSLTVGGVSERPDSCVGDVLTDFHQQQGLVNQMITRRLEMQDPLLRLGFGTKVQFPAGMGDVYNKVILTSTQPTSSVGKNWAPLKAAYPGGPVPSCNTPQVIRYGHLKSQACLEKFSLRTQDFNAVDLTFKTRREQQWNWLINQILPDWSFGTQKFWYREAYRKTVWNVVLNESLQNPRAMGDFPTYCKPTSVLTPDHLDEMYRWLNGYGALQTPFAALGDGMLFHVLATGPDEARALDELDRAQNRDLGVRYNEIVIPGYGKVRTIRNFIILVIDDITRLGENGDGTYYEIDATQEVAVGEGVESVANPAYYNPGVAKYTVNYIWNSSATEWYVPPDFMQFPNQTASSWNGAFNIINLRTPEDPNADNAYFFARFAFGIGPNIDARRGACVLSKAVHRRGRDTNFYHGTTVTAEESTLYPIKTVELARGVAGGLQFQSNATLPTSPAGQHSMYLVTQTGKRAKISSVAWSDTSSTPRAYRVVLTDNSLATVRTCDPWTHFAILPDYEPDTVVVGDDCITCGAPATVCSCDYTAVLTTVNVRNIRLKDGTQLNDLASGFHFPYDVSAAGSGTTGRAGLDTDLTAYLGANGGGSVDVAYSGGKVTLTITGSQVKLAQLVGDAGALNFAVSNCETPGS